MKTQDLIAEATSLPIEERAMLVDSLLKSFNTSNPATDKEWLQEAKKRLAELQSGAVTPIPGKVVFNKIRKRFSR